jgi:hypothetical protein
MHISRFLEAIDKSDPRRSEYRIVLMDGSGNEVDSIGDISGVSYVTDLFLDLKSVVAGEKEIIDGVEDGEVSMLRQAADEYREEDPDTQRTNEVGSEADKVQSEYDNEMGGLIDRMKDEVKALRTVR